MQANYRVNEQYEGKEHWYSGVVAAVHKQPDGSVEYDVNYDDGDFEDGIKAENVKPVKKTSEEKQQEKEETEKESALKVKRQKAKEKARYVACAVDVVLSLFFGLSTTVQALVLMSRAGGVPIPFFTGDRKHWESASCCSSFLVMPGLPPRSIPKCLIVLKGTKNVPLLCVSLVITSFCFWSLLSNRVPCIVVPDVATDKRFRMCLRFQQPWRLFMI